MPDQAPAILTSVAPVYAVGDIHGCAAQLAALLNAVERDADARGLVRPTCVFLGDYVDRGPETRRVIDLLVEGLPRFNKVFLKGNHEDLMLKALIDGDERSGETWIINGGLKTIESYGVDIAAFRTSRQVEEAVLAAMPARHRAFFDGLALYCESDHNVFVHAGFRPGVPLVEQEPADLMWIRNEFLRHERGWPKTVVHGHTPQDEPGGSGGRIGLDTKCFKSGVLTAGLIDGDLLSVIQAVRRTPQEQVSILNRSLVQEPAAQAPSF